MILRVLAVFSVLAALSVSNGILIDPNGASLQDAGWGLDPNGATADSGPGMDPNGARLCYTGCVDPNG